MNKCKTCFYLHDKQWSCGTAPHCKKRNILFTEGQFKSECKEYEQQMTRKEVVEMRGIAYSTLYEWIDKGLLPTYKKERPYFKRSDVENYKPKKVGRPRSVNK